MRTAVVVLLLVLIAVVVLQQFTIRHLERDNADLWYDGAASAAWAEECEARQ